MSEAATVEAPQQPATKPADRVTIVLRVVVGLLALAFLGAAAWLGYAYAVTPAAIRHPQSTHYHFRMQVINNGTPVDFASDAFQTPQNADVCTAAITQQPVHFHDKLDQFVHIHWAGMTGGLVLKNYGWNFLAGPDDTLGYRFDKLPQVKQIEIHSQSLPKPPADAKYYVYTGDQDDYQQRNWNDFLHEDLRDFFAGKHVSSIFAPLVPDAYAHGDDEKLSQLNDVLGSVVIFVQKDQPTDQQIKDRFNHLVPLPASTCGG